MAIISGKVEDTSGNGCAGVVRAYRVLTGELVGSAKSDPSTGLYSITTNYATEPHHVVRSVATVLDKDPLFSNCMIGARLQGANGGTFFHETYGATNWTPSGTPTTSTTTSPFFGTSSLSLNGSSQLTYTSTTKQNSLVNGNNFSYECWFRRGNTSAGSLVGHNHAFIYNSYAGWSLHVNSSGNVIARIRDVAANERLITSTSAIGVDTWTHVEFSVISNNGYLFINGTLEATFTGVIGTAWDMPTAQPIRIGYTEMYGYFTGYIADVRVSSAGRHSASFTAPTAPALTYLTYDTPTGNTQCFDYVIPT